MNNEIKILLTINLEGGKLQRSSDTIKITSKNYVKGSKVPTFSYTKHKPLEAKSIRQSIKITEYAYQHMISKVCANGVKPFIWNKMSKKERLNIHLNQICTSLGGSSYKYELIE